MQTELEAWRIEYDELLMKEDPTIDDMHRIGQIERNVMSRYGFDIGSTEGDE